MRARDEFLSIASHELKTPLTPLKLHVQHLLAAARGGLALELDDVEVSRVVAESVDRVGAHLERAGCALEVDTSCTARVRADRLRVERVLVNAGVRAHPPRRDVTRAPLTSRAAFCARP